MTEDILLRVKAIDPAPNDLPDELWSAATVLDMLDRQQAPPTSGRARPLTPRGTDWTGGLRLAAAATVLLLLIGAIAFALLAQPEADVVEPTPTTLAVGSPSECAYYSFEGRNSYGPGCYDVKARVVWDGTNCQFIAPETAQVGNDVNLVWTNTSDDAATFSFGYLDAASSVDDLAAFDGSNEGTRPSMLTLVASSPRLAPGTVSELIVELSTPGLHAVTCTGGEPGAGVRTQRAADLGLVVSD